MTKVELKDMSFLEVLQLAIFKEELEKQIYLEAKARLGASKQGKLKRMAMDGLIERGIFNAKDMTEAYYHIMRKEANGYSANERQYIQDVCTLAYTRTIRTLQKESDWRDKHKILAFLKDVWEYFTDWLSGRKHES